MTVDQMLNNPGTYMPAVYNPENVFGDAPLKTKTVTVQAPSQSWGQSISQIGGSATNALKTILDAQLAMKLAQQKQPMAPLQYTPPPQQSFLSPGVIIGLSAVGIGIIGFMLLKKGK